MKNENQFVLHFERPQTHHIQAKRKMNNVQFRPNTTNGVRLTPLVHSLKCNVRYTFQEKNKILQPLDRLKALQKLKKLNNSLHV